MSINGVRFAQVQNEGTSSFIVVQSFRVNKGDVLEWGTGNNGKIIQNRLYPII